MDHFQTYRSKSATLFLTHTNFETMQQVFEISDESSFLKTCNFLLRRKQRDKRLARPRFGAASNLPHRISGGKPYLRLKRLAC